MDFSNIGMVKKRVKGDAGKASKKIPFLVKVISVLNYINAAFFAIAAIVLLAYGISGKKIFIEGVTSAAMIVAGVIFIVLGVFAFYIARGLWKGQNWARIVEIVLGIIGVVAGVSGIFQQVNVVSNIIGIVINGLIAGYLAFNRDVKRVFS